MRDSNYKLIGNNRAAVTISTTVYDRRALDVTSDRPLVNSLNHLTYLVSSLAKVRETLSTDGGIERLIEILHECHNSNFSHFDNTLNSEKKILTAWKWTLAFQCLVLIGTRGTEIIRQRVVKAGILPIIATVLDNYITLNDSAFIQANRPFNQTFVTRLGSLQPTGPTQVNQSEGSQNQDLMLSQLAEPSENDQLHSAQLQNSNNNSQPQPPTNESEQYSFLNEFEAFQNNFRGESSNNTELDFSSTLRDAPFFHTHFPGNLTNEDYENLNIDQLLKLVSNGEAFEFYDINSISNIKHRYLILLLLKKIREEKENDFLDTRFLNEADLEMDNNLNFLNEMLIQNSKLYKLSNIVSKPSPRNFTETGVVIPRDDDIIWALQLLAYISKYPYLKDILQNTHLVIDMSVREKQLKLLIDKQLKTKLKKDLAIKQRPTIKPKSRKSKPEKSNNTEDFENIGNDSTRGVSSRLGFGASASNSPQMINGLNSIQDDNFILEQDKLELDEDNANVETGLRVNDSNVEDVNVQVGESDPETGSFSDSDSDLDNFNSLFPTANKNRLGDLYEAIEECELIDDPMDREMALFELRQDFNKQIQQDSKQLSLLITKKRLDQKQYLKEKWDYDTYDKFNIDDQEDYERYGRTENSDDDDSLFGCKQVNLFPIVEKFTFLAGTDMYYWSGVIMRNSCRRNEFRGGVRQCGNLECGRWETYPREFLKCRRCKRTKYCSRDCQMKAWHSHRNWCIPSSSTNNNVNSGSNVEGNQSEEGSATQAADSDINSEQADHTNSEHPRNINSNND